MTLVLYQFELCPFCQKVRAGLELRGIDYEIVEVNPMNKREIEHVDLDENGRKKVPILEIEGEVIRESTHILKRLDALSGNAVRMTREESEIQREIDGINQWVDDYLMQVLPSVLYGTWGQAARAARLTAQASNFSKIDNLKVSIFGSIIMRIIAKKTLKKLDSDEPAETLYARGLDRLEELLTGTYLVGEQPSLADAAVHGALTCVTHFPAFDTAMQRPAIRSWYERISELRRSASPRARASLISDDTQA